jgi:RNA polymerase sigma-70 factor (ECF subfamily)
MREVFHITHASFRQLFDCMFEPLCRFLAYYTTDRMMIEEVVQEIFIKLWEDRDILQIESVKTYLYTSARNRMLNAIRDEKRRNTLLEQWVQHEMEKRYGEECFDIDEFSNLIQSAIDTLPDKCRNIFNLSKKEMLTYKQIAGRLEISIKTVETQMGIALRKIREQLFSTYSQSKRE